MILHVDMDAFYAAIEERDRPELAGKPVIVGGSPQSRGVVSAANYVARKYGVHSAMPAATARRLCPHGVFLPTRMSDYADVARQIREIFLSYTPQVEPLSLDEAFLDVAPSIQLFGSAEQIGQAIKQRIQHQLQLVASVGIAPLKFVAKIASDLQKPNGFVVVKPDEVQSFLDPLPIQRLWGVGQRAMERFERMAIRTVGQLRRIPREQLVARMGKSGEHLWQLSNGIDPRQVVPDHQAKQISHETTFATDITDSTVLESVLMQLTEQVARRVRRNQLHGRTVHLKVRSSDFSTAVRSSTLTSATDSTDTFWRHGVPLLRRHLDLSAQPTRLLGIGISGLGPRQPIQAHLFDKFDQPPPALDKITDQIKDRFGEQSVVRALGMKKEKGDSSI